MLERSQDNHIHLEVIAFILFMCVFEIVKQHDIILTLELLMSFMLGSNGINYI